MALSRRWCFTSFLERLELDPTKFRYVVYQQELCPDTLRLHYQGYVEFDTPKRITGVKRILGECHLEIPNGTREQCKAYCMKEQTRVPNTVPTEIGRWELQAGRRTDIEDGVELIKAGATDRDIVEHKPNFFVKYNKAVDKVRFAMMTDRTDKPYVIWIWGPSGTGKSKIAHQLNPDAYWKNIETKWWDGYYQQDAVILDDMKGQMSIPELLRLFDRYPLSLEIKGGTVKFNSRVIFCTSIDHPLRFYNDFNGELARRIDVISERTNINDPVPALPY